MAPARSPRSRRSQRFPATSMALLVVAGVAALLAACGADGSAASESGSERARGARATPTTARATSPTTPTTADEAGAEPDPTLTHSPHFRATAAVPTLAVRARPDADRPVLHELPERTDLGVPQTLLVEGEARDRHGDVWYRVLLPVKPNGSTGWVAGSDVLVEGLRYRLVVRLSDLRLELRDGDEVEATFPIGVGTDETPTPGGRYYVREVIELTRTDSAYGSHALALNGFSEVLGWWRGGGLLGIHGTNRPDSIGTRASHGCIRMRNDDVTRLAEVVSRGTPVEIVA